MEADTRSIAAICKCLSDENRLKILQTIGMEKRSVSQIVEYLDLSQQVLRDQLEAPVLREVLDHKDQAEILT